MRVSAQPPQSPPTASPAAAAPAAPGAPAAPPVATLPSSARDMYLAARAYRTELRTQLERLEEQRSELRRELRQDGDGAVTGAARAEVEARLADVNGRIAALDQSLAAADMQVATTAAVPGATVEPPRVRQGPPEEVFIIPIVFITFVLGPLAIAAAWRLVKHGAIWGKGAPSKGADKTQQAQLERLTHTVDAMAEELERIGEGQRFLTRVLGDASTSLLAGGAQPLPVAAPEPVPVYRQGEDPARG